MDYKIVNFEGFAPDHPIMTETGRIYKKFY